jgi:hypothetical protein
MLSKPTGHLLLLDLAFTETFEEINPSRGRSIDAEAMEPQEEHANHIGCPLVSVRERMAPGDPAIVGGTDSHGAGDADVYLIKTNSSGNLD